ncbi:MAG: HAD family hydrolase [Planctomycetota bacterium]
MKLLVLDVEGTIFQTTVRLQGTSIDSTIWQAIAQALGPDAVREEVCTHRRWHNGEYRSYLDWMKDTIRIHQSYGLSATVFNKLVAAAEYNPGVIETLTSLDRRQYEPLLVSGGFRELAKRAQVDLGIHHAFAACEYFFDSSGNLTSYNLLPCDFAGKLDFILLMLREYGLSRQDWIFVGDGLNDVPIAKAAPVSVAYSAHLDLREVATFIIDNFVELTSILARVRSPGHSL